VATSIATNGNILATNGNILAPDWQLPGRRLAAAWPFLATDESRIYLLEGFARSLPIDLAGVILSRGMEYCNMRRLCQAAELAQTRARPQAIHVERANARRGWTPKSDPFNS
jgi:hypothetical protein